MHLDPQNPMLIGVMHLPPLPGTPFHDPLIWPSCVDLVRTDVDTLAELGFDGVLLQTDDRVYPTGDEADPARVVAMTTYAMAVRDLGSPQFSLGVQILRHGVSASLAVATLVGLDFIRVDGLVGATLTTHGWVKPNPLQIMSYRHDLRAEHIRMVCDIHSSHFRWPSNDVSLPEVARKAIHVGADAVVIDMADGDEHDAAVKAVNQEVPNVPIVVGGHTTAENIRRRLQGTCGGFVRAAILAPNGRIDRDRAARLVDEVHA